MKNKGSFLGVVILLLIIIGTIYSLFIRPSHYKLNGGEAYLTPDSTYRLAKDFVDLTVIDGFIYECNKNGLIKKTLEGETVWTKSYFIDMPVMEHEGEYIAIADVTGKSVFVFDSKGFLREIKESYPVIDVHINEEGFLTTVQEKEKQNLIHYYNDKGELVIKRVTRFIENGYPIDVASSPDVTKMITGYLNVSNNRLQTQVSFFGFDDQYDSYAENLIGGFKYDNALLSKVLWMNQNSALAIMDNQIVVFDCKSEPQVKSVIPTSAEIIDLVITNEEIVVWYGKVLEESNEEQGNNIIVYDYTGKKIQTLTFDNKIKALSGEKDGFFILTEGQIIKYKGKTREWFSSTYLSITDIYEVDDARFVIETPQGYAVLKMREK